MPDTARTNLGPLTTQFTVPSSCSAVHPNCPTCSVGWQAQQCGTNSVNSQGLQDDPSCWPARANAAVATGDAFFGWGFYSPGVSCPAGYTTACTATGSAGGGFAFQYPLLASETAAGCCPSGYQCQYGAGGAQTCYNVITSGTFPTVSCSSRTSEDYALFTVPGTVTVVATTTTDASITTFATAVVIPVMTVYAPLIQLNWQSDNVASSATTSIASSSSSTSSTSSTTTNSSSSSISGSENSGSSGGIGTGGAIGIGAGIGGVAVLLLGVLAWFLLIKRRRQRATTPPSKNDGASYQEVPHQGAPYPSGYDANKPVSEMGGQHRVTEMGGYHPFSEMGSNHRDPELHDTYRVAEMEGYHGVAELPSGR